MKNSIIEGNVTSINPGDMGAYLDEFQRIDNALLPLLEQSPRNPARKMAEIQLDETHLLSIQRLQTVNGYNAVERTAYLFNVQKTNQESTPVIGSFSISRDKDDPDLGTWVFGHYHNCQKRAEKLIRTFLEKRVG